MKDAWKEGKAHCSQECHCNPFWPTQHVSLSELLQTTIDRALTSHNASNLYLSTHVRHCNLTIMPSISGTASTCGIAAESQPSTIKGLRRSDPKSPKQSSRWRCCCNNNDGNCISTFSQDGTASFTRGLPCEVIGGVYVCIHGTAVCTTFIVTGPASNGIGIVPAMGICCGAYIAGPLPGATAPVYGEGLLRIPWLTSVCGLLIKATCCCAAIAT